MLQGAPKGTEVSLSGYFEPKGDDMDEDMFGGYQDEEDDEDDDLDDGDSESDEETGNGLLVQGKAIGKKQQESKQLSDSLKQATQNKNKNASQAQAEDDSEDSDEDDDDEDE